MSAPDALLEAPATPEPPDPRHEAWRYSPTSALVDGLRNARRPDRGARVDLAGILGCLDHRRQRLVFLDGAYDPRASSVPPLRGTSIQPSSRSHRPTSGHGRSATGWFDHLNTAAPDDAAVIRVEGGTTVEGTIHIVHVSQVEGDPAATHPSTTIEVAAGASVEVIETYCSVGGAGATNAVTSIDLADGARVRYHRVLDEHADGVHHGLVRAEIGAGAHLRTTSMTFGSAAGRVAVEAHLVGEQGSFDLDVLYVVSGSRHHDHVVTVDHAASDTTSSQMVRGIVGDRARGSFTGHVIVPSGVSGIEADQSSRALLLSPHGQVDARPWLEILADDVRATHGAAIGRIDDDAVFYLRSRGIPEAEARHLLLEAFATEATEGIHDEQARERHARLVSARLRRDEELGP